VILVDTSVWVDHLRATDDRLVSLLESGTVLTHPFVIGEIALGSLHRPHVVLGALRNLPQAIPANDEEVLSFIDDEAAGLGIGYIDAHLLAATRLTPDTSFWTRDRRLAAVAEKLSLAARFRA
jgi:predicted nucleic acid-binding protein